MGVGIRYFVVDDHDNVMTLSKQRLTEMALDLPVVAFTMVTALATGIVFGLVPAFVSTSHASDAVREGGRHGGGRRLQRVLRTLVVDDVALSLVLLAGAGLLMRSLVKLQSVDLGFRPEGVLTVGVRLPATRYDLSQAGSFFRESLSHRRAPRGSARGRGLVPAGSIRVRRHELLARRSAKAGGWPAGIRPGAADYAGILQDDGDSTRDRT